ncbi:MAG: cobyrinate a,c-diamide synthase [Vagococcus sp.]|uniref:cobyrinate a,c-diamide synthase n=1 Tax=Vagococcus sp. TaxID=1933889 RepID=UPI002FC86B02
MKKILIGAASSGSGKTTFTLGLLEILRRKNLDVQPFKVGPDYVDTRYHSRITKNPSRNLDNFLVRKNETLNYLFEHAAYQSDVAVIEGVMGLFDGFGIDKDCCSSSAVAKELNCPVILVVNGKSASTSIAAVVKGFEEFDENLNIMGVVINNIASENHYSLVKGAIEKYTKTKVYGYIAKNPAFALPSRQLGLVPENEIDDVLEIIGLIADSIEKTVDIDQLLYDMEEVEIKKPKHPFNLAKQFKKITLGIAHDPAFHFYYPDNLELLEDSGVEIVYFSPMKDEKLPEADAYYFGGGYPEEFAKELSENESMRKSVYKAFEENKIILAECGGLMYLGTSLQIEDSYYPMVGIFEGQSQMTSRLKRFGYCYGILNEDTLLGEKGDKIYGHEFHHSIFETNESTVMTMEKNRDGEIVSSWEGGYQKKRVFASYLHLHFFQSETFVTQLLTQMTTNGDVK